MRLSRLLRALFEYSPKDNLDTLRERLSQLKQGQKCREDRGNAVLGEVMESPALIRLLTTALLKTTESPLVLAGNDQRFAGAVEALRAGHRQAEWRTWRWGDGAETLVTGEPGRVALCVVPETADEWAEVASLKRRLAARLTLLPELLLPFTRITFLLDKVDYFIKDFDRLTQHYTGDWLFGKLDQLNTHWPLAGRSVIEFGPFDGGQTAALVRLGVRNVTCIEARAENVTKTRTAAEVFDWPQVRVIMDDFHNADATKYGRYDMAFAHGVYYHSVAPFVFLDNLLSLAPAIFLGGFCATDESPPGPWMELVHEGRTYRVKQYRETDNFTAGVNPVAYFFHGDDLLRFFSERGYAVTTISDEPKPVTAGRFLRFLALAPADDRSEGKNRAIE
jgi:hypothetical protein